MYTQRADRRRTLIDRAWRFLSVVALATAAACADGPASGPAGPVEPRTAIDPGPYVPGQMYTGRNGYIEYYPGNSPMIFAAPHGGLLKPDEIPPRTTDSTSCDAPDIVTLADLYTRELVMEIRTAFYNRTGRYPHVVVNRVHRARVEPNRDLLAGACQDPEAEIAWNEYHEFIEVAKARVEADHGRGWFTDIHGHAHPIKRLELGYLLEGSDLRLSDATLDGNVAYENESSFRTLSANTTVSFSRVLRGPAGLGTLLQAEGYASVPSGSTPAPLAGEPYFSGGYSTDRHTCIRITTNICGLQIEHDSTVKVPQSARANYAAALVRTYETYLAQNFGFNLGTGRDDIMVDDDNANNDTTRARFTAGGSWTSAAASAGTHLNSVRLAAGAAATEDSASFAFYIDSPGDYDLYARWPSAADRPAFAMYRLIYPDGSSEDLPVPQQLMGGQWVPLATLSSTQAGWGRVVILRASSGAGTLAADAIRVVEQ